MPSQLEDLIKEIESVHTAISDYAESLGTYLFNPTQPYPELDQNKLTVDTLLTNAKNTVDSAVDITSGVFSSMTYKVAGIARELGTRGLTKAQLYDVAVNEAALATDEIRGDSGKKVSQVRSTTPEQAEGQ